jgi:hypothetical protein
MLKSMSILVAFLMSLSLLTGCGSSSNSVTYDSGLASGSHVADADSDVVVVARDTESNRELASTVVKAGTLLLDADSNPVNKEVTYKLIANSEKVSDTAVETKASLQITDADGVIIDGISSDLDVNIISPKLKSMGEAKAVAAVYVIEDAALAAHLRGALVLNPDGSVDVTITYKAGRTWRIMWTYLTDANDEPITGAVGGN